MFRSTPPHGRRQDITGWMHGENQVSIHAPAWEAALPARPRCTPSTSFDPRPRMGGGPGLCYRYRERIVSIHAPAWEAAWRRSSKNRPPCRFDPRPRMGGGAGSRRAPGRSARFDPRPRMGGGQIGGGCHHQGQLCFDPRPRMGGGFATIATKQCALNVSIHAPAWEAAICGHGCACGKNVSIHAPAWEAARLWSRRISI